MARFASSWKQYIGNILSCWSRSRIVNWSVFTLPRSWGKNVRFPAEAHRFQINCGLAHRKRGWLLHCSNCRSMQPIAGFAVLRLHRLLQCWWKLSKCISSKRKSCPAITFHPTEIKVLLRQNIFFPVLWKRQFTVMWYSKSSSTLILYNSTSDCDSALIQAIEKNMTVFCLRLTCQRQCCSMGNLLCKPIHRAAVFVFVTPQTKSHLAHWTFAMHLSVWMTSAHGWLTL